MTSLPFETNIKYEEQRLFLTMIKEAYVLYRRYGARSNKKTIHIQKWYANMLNNYYVNKLNINSSIECKVSSYNYSGNKNCDIVLKENGKVIAIFPLKFVCSNYKQNRNNYWECLGGECLHLKMQNPNVKIIPINIFFTKCPYKKKNGVIHRFEYYDRNVYKLYKVSEGLPMDSFINVLVNNDNLEWDNSSLFTLDQYDSLYGTLKKLNLL